MFRRGGHRRNTNARSHSSPSQSPSMPLQSNSLPGTVPSPSPPVEQPNVSSSVPSVQQSLVEAEDSRELIGPRGDSFPNSVHVIHELNKIVNNHWGGASMTYTSTPEQTKNLWWNEFQRVFTWDESEESEIKRIFKKKCGDHIRYTLSHAKIKGKKPNCITEENWSTIVKSWESEESKRRSEQNKKNQACNSGALSATYAGGSINIDEHTQRMAKEMGSEPLFIDTFTRTFQKKDKTWSGERARTIKEKYDELAQRSSDASDDPVESESSVDNMSLWIEATGGPKGGRILGLGSLIRTCKIGGTSSSTPPALKEKINQLNDEVSHLKELLVQKDNELKEVRTEFNEQLNEFRRQ